MSDLQRACHTRYILKYHFVWSCKYRKKLLIEKDRQIEFRRILKEIGEKYWINFEVVGTDGDHVHLFLSAAPRYSPSELAKIIKSISAKKLFERFPEIRELLWGGELWEDGYFVRSVGDEVTEDVVKEYIEKQGKEDNITFEQLNLFKL
jgi:putative transposase